MQYCKYCAIILFSRSSGKLPVSRVFRLHKWGFFPFFSLFLMQKIIMIVLCIICAQKNCCTNRKNLLVQQLRCIANLIVAENRMIAQSFTLCLLFFFETCFTYITAMLSKDYIKHQNKAKPAADFSKSVAVPALI